MKERLQIIEQLGSGGFGCVYKAHDTKLGRDVAIKRLKSESLDDNIQLKEQLLSEARVLAGLHHPNIVTIFDVVENDLGGEIIMKLVDGETLDEIIKKSPLDVNQFLFVATQLLSAIATAHEHDILHCDLKPSNIMLSRLGDDNFHTTVLDFGLSPSRDSKDTGSSDNKLVGSIYFMAPELMDSGNVSTKSDIYSLGCLFYYMLTGTHPFKGESSVAVMASHIRNSYTPLKEINDEFPDSLCGWVEAHIQQNPEDRVGSCREALDQLLSLKGFKPIETLSEIYPDTNITSTMLHSLSSLSKASVKISDKQKEEFAKSKRPTPSTTPQDLVPISKRYQQARPESLWYFSINGERKGPVHFSQICELIAQGFVRSNDPIWHPRIGQWTPAIQIPEFKEEFTAAKVMPPRPKKKKKISLRNSTRIKAQQDAATQAIRLRVKEEEMQPYPIEITVLIALSVISTLVIWFLPASWQITILSLSFILFLFAFLFIRKRMLEVSPKWLALGLLVPLLSDAIFAVARPKQGAQSFVLLLLSLFLIGFATAHRYVNDTISLLHLDFISDLLKLITGSN